MCLFVDTIAVLMLQITMYLEYLLVMSHYLRIPVLPVHLWNLFSSTVFICNNCAM